MPAQSSALNLVATTDSTSCCTNINDRGFQLAHTSSPFLVLKEMDGIDKIEAKDKDPVKFRRRWAKRWRRVRVNFEKQGDGPRPRAWPNDHLDRGVGTPGWDRSGASGSERGP